MLRNKSIDKDIRNDGAETVERNSHHKQEHYLYAMSWNNNDLLFSATNTLSKQRLADDRLFTAYHVVITTLRRLQHEQGW